LKDISQEVGKDAEQKREIRQLVRKIDIELSSEDYWEQFQLNFDQVHQQFSQKLHLRHPQLSPNDIRLCCLLRINMTNKEIASIQNISLGAVEKSKFRLKKKLDLEKDLDLNLYILELT
jgi:DNA-binding CsgD family transcriptional regulator